MIDASTPARIESGAERRPDLPLLEVRERGRQGARPQDEREVLRFLQP